MAEPSIEAQVAMAKKHDVLADKVLHRLIDQLTERLGRVPETDEVMTMINGTADERMAVWNQYQPVELTREQRRKRLLWQREHLPWGM